MKHVAMSLVICASMVACKSTDTAIQPEGGDPSVGGGAGALAGGGSNGGSTSAAGAGGVSDGGASAGSGGTNASGGTSATGGAAGRAAHTTCRTDLPGPKLVDVTAGDGTGFCIDATPVTAGQYGEFLKAKASDTSGQGKECTWNTTFVPQASTESMIGCVDVATVYHPDTHPEWPMVCTDYCDAVAYCQWAGKRLCGRLANAGDWPTPLTGDDSPIGTELTYACTQGGKTTYIYGDTYDAKAEATGVEDAQAKAAVNKGNTPPFDQLTGFNGYPAQWEEGCLPGATPELPPSACHIRGGGVSGTAADANALRCDRAPIGSPTSQTSGLRCCTD